MYKMQETQMLQAEHATSAVFNVSEI